MLKASLGFMFSHGFRARSQPGHHIAIIDFVRSRIDKKHAGLLVVFDRLRRKRNTALYDDTGFVSHHDAEQALESAGDYLNVIQLTSQAESLESETDEGNPRRFSSPAFDRRLQQALVAAFFVESIALTTGSMIKPGAGHKPGARCVSCHWLYSVSRGSAGYQSLFG